MKRIRILLLTGTLILAAVMIGVVFRSQLSSQAGEQNPTLLAGRNVNMVSGTKLPLGDPWLQRQNEPSVAVSSRNPWHLFAAANDYRTIDMVDDYNLRGIQGFSAVRDSWIGVFESFNNGESWITTLLPGFPQDTSVEAQLSPIRGFDTACDPITRAGANGLFYLSGIAFNRSQQAGAVFVARYVDLNNREKVEEGIDPASKYKKYIGPIEYMDTRLVDAGNPGQFIDMPNMAVDVPRSGRQFGNVYVAYTVFLGNTSQLVRSRIVLVRSGDGGVTWSAPIKLTESQHIIQRPIIAIDPSDPAGKTIYVVFRRFAFGTAAGGIVFVKSVDGGLSFTKPIDVATLLYPFDQGTSTASFRTNSYPTMAIDGSGIAYVAWAQRYAGGLPNAGGQARIVISCLPKGSLVWSAPMIVDQPDPVDGHQFMPTMTFAGGRLMLAWYDQRDDINLHEPNTKFIEDGNDHRHTIDVRAAEGTPGTPPAFSSSILVSRYLYFMQLDSNGVPTPFEDGSLVMQGQYDFINFPLFEKGTKPFHGDYMEIVSSPQVLPPPASASNSWLFNTSPSEPTTSPVVWTDNRDVWPPAGNLWGDWLNYNPPTSSQDLDFGQTYPCSNNDNAGMKNQNVYTANLNHGVIVGSPGNSKQLNIQRTFVVVVKNATDLTKAMTLALYPGAGVSASFEQSSSASSLSITVLPFSSVSCTVFTGASGGFGSVRVDAREGPALVGRVYLNPDSTNNPIDLGDERHDPKMSNPKVWKYDVGNPKEPNSSFMSPRAQNPRAQNSGYVNPRAQNTGVLNPRAQNPRAQNENIVNNEMYNPRAQNPSAQNTALTDMTWTISNDGNTTSAYRFNIVSDSETIRNLFNQANPPLIGQILVYKLHTVPIDNQCQLLQTHADELIVNVSNPRAQNPRAQNTAPTAKSVTTLGTNATAQSFGENDATFNLAPGEEAKVIFRVYDPVANDPYSFDEYINHFAGETEAEAINTGESAPRLVTQPNVPWGPTPLPMIGASPSSFTFEAVVGTNPGYQTLTVSNLGAGALDYSISDNAGWLSVSSLSGNSSAVSVDTTGLGVGTYKGIITITDPYATNNPLRVPVTLTISPVVGPAEKLVFTQSPGGGLAGGVWAIQPIVEVQDAAGQRVTSDNSTQVTLIIDNNPGSGELSGTTTVTVSAGRAIFSGLGIDKGGWDYSLQAVAGESGLTTSISSSFDVEGFSGTAGEGMESMRGEHTATLIVGGKVLITGGLGNEGVALSTAEIYDPADGTFTPAGSLMEARYGHTATLLPDGKVLILGGKNAGNFVTSTAEMYDPNLNSFTYFRGGMNVPRYRHTATLLNDGTVLIAGGMNGETIESSAELYDPDVESGFVLLEVSMAVTRYAHTATKLSSGYVLIAGGGQAGVTNATVQLFIPGDGGTFSGTMNMSTPRMYHTATQLSDGRVLIAGGSSGSADLDSADIYTGPSWPISGTGTMTAARQLHTATLLFDGKVLIAGGAQKTGFYSSAEMYDPVAGNFTGKGDMFAKRGYHTATVLSDGRVLIAGGSNELDGTLGSAEIFWPKR